MGTTPAAYKFDQFFATRRIVDFAPVPDGDAILFVSDISGQLNLWRVPTSGGWPEQLTLFVKESVRSVTCSRDGNRIAFVADPDGNEMQQVYLLDANGGWPEQVTAAPAVQHSIVGGAFSPDGQSIAYAGNATDPKHVDIYLRDIATGTVRQVTAGGRIMYPAGFSPDGRYLRAVEHLQNVDQDLWLIDLQTGENRNLTAHTGRMVKHDPGPWRNDGKGFYYCSDDGRDFTALGFYDLEAERGEVVIKADWDIESTALSGDGSMLAYTINDAGNSVLHVLDLTTGRELTLPPLPKGVIMGLHFAPRDSRRRLFLHMSTYASTYGVYVLDLDQGSLSLLTPVMLGNIPAEVFVAPQLVHIKAFDGLSIQAWLYQPHGMAPGQKAPAVLSIHGGPEGQERTSYLYGGFYQYLLNQGVAVLAPNIRGSNGFGSDYQKRIYRDWGGAELKDIEACTQYLQGVDWIDPKRLAVWGGSFGGFATLSAATRLPTYWACACDFCGPANLVTFADSVPPHWKAFMKGWVGDPEADREMLLARSPITYVEHIRCPLMVVQGANDPRVVKAESDQMVERLRSLGRDVEYLVFADEGHGFAKRANQLKGYKAMADFLLQHLQP